MPSARVYVPPELCQVHTADVLSEDEVNVGIEAKTEPRGNEGKL